MTVTAYPLSHNGVESSAFVIRSGSDVMLCMGDTGPDAVERSHGLADLWAAIAPDIRLHRLRAIVVEASYANGRPDAELFGHLTPAWLIASLRALERAAGGNGALKGISVIVAHVKYPLDGRQTHARALRRELEEGSDLGVKFIVPSQGQYWRL
jgi:3',5'-cyclic-nucleotide phosphodiesterase